MYRLAMAENSSVFSVSLCEKKPLDYGFTISVFTTCFIKNFTINF